MRALKEFLKRFDLLRIPVVFVKRVLTGYRLYSRLISKYGDDTELLATAWRGNGDYYICALYLKAWLERNGVKNFVFLTPGGSEEKVLALFPICSGHTYQIRDENQFVCLLNMRCFLGPAPCRFRNLHHQQAFPYENITSGNLRGFRGLNMVDFYLTMGYGLGPEAPREQPRFPEDRERMAELFRAHRLIPGKTVLLAPYSTGLEQFAPPRSFWAGLAQRLRQAGYTVCTNCAGEETPIPGTVRLSLPFRELVPFLNIAGCFIALRSGLCDVASTSTCKKLILHPRQAKWWPAGASIAYTGLNNMALCEDAVEVEVFQSRKNSKI